jgi:phosphoserine phosphatase
MLAGRGQSLNDVSESWFSSGSLNDLPLLEIVKNPIAVAPDAT